jgi:hypothetical protein
VGALGADRRSACRYCDLQLQNDKTAAVLLRSFRYLGGAGEMFVARYMTEVLFDHAFHYDVDDATKQALRENREDVGVSGTGGMSRTDMEAIREKIMDGIQQGFAEAEEQGLESLGEEAEPDVPGSDGADGTSGSS